MAVILSVGMTGGIGCGRTSVAAMLADRGCHVIDADQVGHELIAPGQPGWEPIVAEFGRGILGADGRIDRQELGGIVFGDPDKLAKLNSILHPRIEAECQRRQDALAAEIPEGIVVTDAALMIEARIYERYDRLVVVTCELETRLERLAARGVPRDEALRRIGAQMPVDEKAALADHVIDNSGTRDETDAQVVEVYRRLRGELTRLSSVGPDQEDNGP